MKRLFSLLLIVCSLSSLAQTKVNRSGKANTVQDFRLHADSNFAAPRYTDTSAANRSIGLDSTAALIYTYDVKGYWFRSHAPKRWVRFGSVLNLSAVNDSTLSYTDGSGVATNLPLQGKRNKFYYDGYGITMPNDSTFDADTAQLATLWDLNNLSTSVGGALDTSDTNFATHDLTATGHRTHLWGTNSFTLRGQNANSYLNLTHQADGGSKWTLQSVDGANHWMGTYSEPDYYEVFGDYGVADHYAQMRFRLFGPTSGNQSHMLLNLVRGAYTVGTSAYIGTTAGNTHWAGTRLSSIANTAATVALDSAGAYLGTGTRSPLAYPHFFRLHNNGALTASSLKTGGTAPAQSGTVKYVTTDSAGRLSFADGPAAVDTSGRTYYVRNGLTPADDSTHEWGGYLEHLTRVKGRHLYPIIFDSTSGFYANVRYSGYDMDMVQQGDTYSLTQTHTATGVKRNEFYWNTTRMYFYNYLGQYSFELLPQEALSVSHQLLSIDQNDLISRVSSFPEYADQAAAVAAGLDNGDIYHTAGVLKVVYGVLPP
jgi:hypothetical protein